MTSFQRLAILLLLVGIGVFGPACDDDDEGFTSTQCRLDPERCNGGTGGVCRENRDCASNFCCRDNDNCGDGMCTFRCEGDRDCPASMLCEHNLCFYQCESDRDCAETMSCEHGNTICEYK